MKQKLIYLWLFLAGFLLFLEGHYLNSLYNYQIDLTENRIYTLTQATKKLLKSLPTDPKFVFLLPKSHPDYSLLLDILVEYQKIRPGIQIEELDLFRNPSQFEKYQAVYRKITRSTVLVVVLGKREKYLTLYDLKLSGTLRAEEAISTALASLANLQRLKVVFSQGHGEPSLRSTLPFGLSRFANYLVRENYDVKGAPLVEGEKASLLFLIRLREEISFEEERILRSFLEKGGTLVIFLDPELPNPCPRLLRDYGVFPLPGRVIEPKAHQWRDPQYVVVRDFADHPAGEALSHFSTAHPGVLAFRLEEKQGVEHKVLLRSTEEAKLSVPSQVQPPYILGVLAKKGKGKILLFGDAHFVLNGVWRGTRPIWGIEVAANGDFILQTLSSLFGTSHFSYTEGRRIQNFRMKNLTSLDIRRIWWFTCVFLPSVALFLGITLWLFRRG